MNEINQEVLDVTCAKRMFFFSWINCGFKVGRNVDFFKLTFHLIKISNKAETL